jgi:hypothetical protein
VDKIRTAHKKLPLLFRHIKTDTKIAYPFKYDCLTGKFLHPNLEDSLRKNIACGNGQSKSYRLHYTSPWMLSKNFSIYIHNQMQVVNDLEALGHWHRMFS